MIFNYIFIEYIHNNLYKRMEEKLFHQIQDTKLYIYDNKKSIITKTIKERANLDKLIENHLKSFCHFTSQNSNYLYNQTYHEDQVYNYQKFIHNICNIIQDITKLEIDSEFTKNEEKTLIQVDNWGLICLGCSFNEDKIMSKLNWNSNSIFRIKENHEFTITIIHYNNDKDLLERVYQIKSLKEINDILKKVNQSCKQKTQNEN